MWIRIATTIALAAATSSFADGPTLLDRTMATCVGPGFGATHDRYALITDLPEESCLRACDAALHGCKASVRGIDQCGVSLLRAEAKMAVEICLGLGGAPGECRAIRNSFRPQIEWWKDAGKVEQADCDADVQASCFSQCVPVPPRAGPIQVPSSTEGGVGSVTVRIDNFNDLVPNGLYENGSVNGGASGVTIYLGPSPFVLSEPQSSFEEISIRATLADDSAGARARAISLPE
jgi:hypothetical protein